MAHESGREAEEKTKADSAISEIDLVVLDVTSDAAVKAARRNIEEKYGKLGALVVSPLFCRVGPTCH